VRAGLFQLLGQADVVFQVVFAALGVEQVAGVAQRAFAQCAGVDHRVHRHAHVVDPVERVETRKHVHAVFRRLLHKVAHHVVA
jgi:vacuolar-type H+-ATPase subunit B/Vma2